MHSQISWEKVVQAVKKAEGKENPHFICSTTAKSLFAGLMKIYPTETTIDLSPEELKAAVKQLFQRPNSFPTDQEKNSIYQWHINNQIGRGAKAIYLVLAPDHHVIYVKTKEVWILLNSWVTKFGLNFWAFVDHENAVKYLQLNKESSLQKNWKFYSAMVCSYMIQHCDANIQFPKDLDRKKLIEYMSEAKTFFLKGAQIQYFKTLK